MEMKQIMVVAVVAVVMAATVGIGWMVLSDKKAGEEPEIDAELEVYGNANNDGRIDSADIDVIREIISGERPLDGHPLSDANRDGVVDEDDIAYVQRIMGATPENRVRIYHVNHTTEEGRGWYVADTMYPIVSAAATGAANSLLMFKYLGIKEEIKALSYGKTRPDQNLFFEFGSQLNGPNLGIVGESTSATNINITTLSNIVTSEGVTAVITADNKAYVSNESTENGVEAMGVDVVRIKPSTPDMKEFKAAARMIAFLFDTGDKGYMDRCDQLVEWCDGFLADLNDKISGITDRVSAVSSSSDKTVGTRISEYTKMLQMAGATFPLTDIDGSKATVKYSEAEKDTWLANYEIDYIMNIRVSPTGTSWYGGNVTPEKVKAMFTQFSKTAAYEEGKVFVICGDMPVMLRVAYSAGIMYSELFAEGWADALHLDFAKKFMGFENPDDFMEGKKFVISMTDAGLA